MKLPANYFDNLSNSKYKQYLKMLPDMSKEDTQLITTLILTFVALTFFGIFAINPTLTTIVDLQKQLDDSQFTKEQLTTKIANLSALQQQYTNLSPDLPLIEDAVPSSANATKLAGQLHSMTQESDLKIRNMRISTVQIAGGTNAANAKGMSYIFTVEAEGTYENMMQFAENVTNFNRIVTVETISIGRDPKSDLLVLYLRGRQYFKP
jgi:Tfp pilus assembly protein PilO